MERGVLSVPVSLVHHTLCTRERRWLFTDTESGRQGKRVHCQIDTGKSSMNIRFLSFNEGMYNMSVPPS